MCWLTEDFEVEGSIGLSVRFFFHCECDAAVLAVKMCQKFFMMLSFYDSKDVVDEAFPDFWLARCGVDCRFFKMFQGKVGDM